MELGTGQHPLHLEHYLEMRKKTERAKGSKVKKKREDKKKRKAEFTFKAVHC